MLTQVDNLATLSWTDDLPPCMLTGTGVSLNERYNVDGHKKEAHPFEDRSFNRSSVDICIYGVFDGNDGYRIAEFALQQLAAELLFEITVITKDEEVKENLRRAFLSVERNYLKMIDEKVAERTSLLDRLSDDLSEDQEQRIHTLKRELSSGTTAVLALVIGDRLFVANVGNSRALLCKTDDNGVLRVIQLSVDHDTFNEDENLRLLNLGLKVQKGSVMGNQMYTRCLGNYLVKGGYKEYLNLSSATEEPVIAEPEIHGPFKLDDSCRFLLLMSDGLFKSLEQAKQEQIHVNKEIAQMVDAEFRIQQSLKGVAQAVVDRVVKLHREGFSEGRHDFIFRDDITLLVRNFSHPLPNAIDQGQELTGSIGTESSESTHSDCPKFIPAYVDFTEFRRNIQRAKENGTLPPELDF